jgi:hypothetical protein
VGGWVGGWCVQGVWERVKGHTQPAEACLCVGRGRRCAPSTCYMARHLAQVHCAVAGGCKQEAGTAWSLSLQTCRKHLLDTTQEDWSNPL